MKKFAVSALIAGLFMTGVIHSPIAAATGVSEHVAVWFEIPVVKMDRAVAFYNTILGVNLKLDKSLGVPMAIFPAKPESVTGALVQMDEMKPGPDGPTIYLNGGKDLQAILDRVVPAGGKILVPKTKVSDQIGFFAIFLDTEGNKLGLFSPPK